MPSSVRNSVTVCRLAPPLPGPSPPMKLIQHRENGIEILPLPTIPTPRLGASSGRLQLR
jgi:hypothetical protein